MFFFRNFSETFPPEYIKAMRWVVPNFVQNLMQNDSPLQFFLRDLLYPNGKIYIGMQWFDEHNLVQTFCTI